MSESPPANPTTAKRHSRRTGRYGRGEAMVWLMGGALVLNVAMIVALVALIAVKGLDAFWPRPIDLVTLDAGERFLGVPVREEVYDAPIERRRELAAQVAAGEVSPDALAKDGRPVRRLYRTGNRDLGQEPFRWVTLAEIASVERPKEAVFVERMEWGVFLGVPEAVLVETLDSGPHTAEGPEAAWAAIEMHLPDAIERRERIRALQRSKIGPINGKMSHLRERLTQARIEMVRTTDDRGRGLAVPLWLGVIVLAGVLLIVPRVLTRRERASGRPDGVPVQRLVLRGCTVLAVGLLLLVWLERPQPASLTPEAFEALQVELAQEQADLDQTYQEFTTQIAAIRDVDDQFRVLIRDPGLDRVAPERQTTPDVPLRLSQIVRIIQPNALTTRQKFGVYFDRWWEFLTDDPREANTEGGVFPVLFGTVLLTILLSIIVVPLGVLAALYLREYAKQGFVTSVLRIAVNNLAGVPSIVYGVFGLGFFCYTLGAYVDAGPGEA
ncbi:Phosphate transport system permease protein PstA (TC 3.A.1.7.1), partial [hydrothermal vent metagenome]